MMIAARADAAEAAIAPPPRRRVEVTDEVIRIPHARRTIPRARVARVRVRPDPRGYAVVLAGAEVVVDELESQDEADGLKRAIEAELER